MYSSANIVREKHRELYVRERNKEQSIVDAIDAGRFRSHSGGEDTTARCRKRAADAVAKFDDLIASHA